MSKTKNKIPISTLIETVEKNSRGACTCDLSPKSLPVLHNVSIISHRLKIRNNLKEICRFHNLFVLKIHLSGNSKGYVGNNVYDFVPGEGILIFPFQMHKIVSADPEGQLRLVINFSLSLQDQADFEPLRNKIFKVSAEDCQLLNHVVELAYAYTDIQQREAINLLTEFLMNLLKKIDSSKEAVTQRTTPGIVFDYLHKHYREGLSVKELADRLGYSEAGIRLIFRRETGRTPSDFMKELALHDAAEKLHYTDKSIQEISRECGFRNPYIFSRAFKNKIGKSPKDFRESLRQK